jgi:hypothetical protein
LSRRSKLPVEKIVRRVHDNSFRGPLASKKHAGTGPLALKFPPAGADTTIDVYHPTIVIAQEAEYVPQSHE